MSGCGLDSMILADARPVDNISESMRSQDMRHWIFENALDYDIAPHALVISASCAVCAADARGMVHIPVRTLLETYPELAGLFVNTDGVDTQFIQEAVADAMDAARPDAPLYLRCLQGEPGAIVGKITRRGDRPVRYSVKYTGDHLVDTNPDMSFSRWVDAVGAQNVLAEFRSANFEPWTSFSFETVEGILRNLNDMNCSGFSLMPLSMNDWPKTSDTYFKYQFQRDLVWYSVWGGSNVAQLLREGQPKWLLRNKRVLEGFQAGSRILELLSLYIAADKTDRWRPQLCSIIDPDTNSPRLLSIEDMLHLDSNWWKEVTGDEVVHPAQYVQYGTPENAYGPEELIEELADLSAQATAAGDKGMRNNSGEKELPGFTRDAFCMGRLGEFYVERFKAALAHARGEDVEALDHMNRALGLYREIRAVDSSHRRGESIRDAWTATIKALESEYESAAARII